MSQKLTTGFFPERFTVSAEGMGDLSKDRFEGLIYELVQNVFDEDSATFAVVSVYYYTGKGVRVVVKDDGERVRESEGHVRDIRSQPEARHGRKARSLQLGSAAGALGSDRGEGDDGGLYRRVSLATGGRVVRRNRREKGTEVVVVMPWSIIDAETLRQRLRLIRPPKHCAFRINGREVTHPCASQGT